MPDLTDEFPVVIYHNPDCETSRNALGMIRAAGFEPAVIEYLKAGWRRGQLKTLMGEAGVSARGFLREKGTSAAELGLLQPGVREDDIIEAMIAHPILVNRPIVVTPKGVKLCRPSEVVFDLLPRKPDQYVKEDGVIVVLADGG